MLISFFLEYVPLYVILPLGFLCSFGVTICCAVSPDKNTLLGKVSNFMNYELWGILKRCVFAVPGGKWVYEKVLAFGYWAAFKPNPLLQIVYFALVFGGFGMMVVVGYPSIPNMYMAEFHKYMGGAVVFGTLYAWYLACTKSAGVITAENWETFDNYEYDNLIFGQGQYYKYDDKLRPKIPKLPRSKHDGITDKVYAKFDHFCPWLNNAVGEQNYRYFILFLLMTTWTLFYGIFASWSIILSVVHKERLMEAEFHNRATGEVIHASYRIIFQWLMFHHQKVMMLMLLCTVMGIVVFLFTLYHLYLAGTNVTTNESFKWSHYRTYWNREQAKKAKEQGEDKFRCCTCLNYCIGAKGGDVFPSNKYDEGVMKNFYSVVFPKSMYKRSASRFTDLKKWDRVLKRIKKDEEEEEEAAQKTQTTTTDPVKKKVRKRKPKGKKNKVASK